MKFQKTCYFWTARFGMIYIGTKNFEKNLQKSCYLWTHRFGITYREAKE